MDLMKKNAVICSGDLASEHVDVKSANVESNASEKESVLKNVSNCLSAEELRKEIEEALAQAHKIHSEACASGYVKRKCDAVAEREYTRMFNLRLTTEPPPPTMSHLIVKNDPRRNGTSSSAGQ